MSWYAAANIWCCFIATFGAVGNLLTGLTILADVKRDIANRNYLKEIACHQNVRRKSGNLSHKVESPQTKTSTNEQNRRKSLPTNFKFNDRKSLKFRRTIVKMKYQTELQLNLSQTNNQIEDKKSSFEKRIEEEEEKKKKVWKKRIETPPSPRFKHKSFCFKFRGDTLLLLQVLFCDFMYCTINLPLTYYVYQFEIHP